MKLANLGRGLVILAAAAFFGYRYWQLGGPFYLFCLVILAVLALTSLSGTLTDRWQNITFNLSISLVFLDFVFANIDWGELAAAFAAANYWMLVPATLLVLIHLYFRTVRWQWLLKPMGEVGFWPAFRALVIGIGANTVLPARAGEFLRAYVIGRSTGISKTGAFATLVVERVFDGLTVLFLLLVVVILGTRDERLQTFGLIGGAFYIGVLIALFVFIFNRQAVDNLIHQRLPDDLADLMLDLIDGFSKGLSILKNPQQLAMVTLWNALTWVVVPISFWVTLLAFDFGSPIPWQTPTLMLPALGMALSVPGAPGGVGLFQAAVKLTMDITYADLPQVANFDEVVAAVSIVLHISQFGPEVILGLFSFIIEGLSTRDIQAGRKIAKDQVVEL